MSRRRFSVIRLLLRSLVSTLVIAAVGFTLVEVRSGRFESIDFLLLATAYWPFLLGLFLALVIWDCWFWYATSHEQDHSRRIAERTARHEGGNGSDAGRR